MSYNLLADSHAWKYQGELYRNKDEDLLRWSRRLRGILAEIRLLKPDILCLQECEDFVGVERALSDDGYVGMHAPRAGGRRDGSSIFFRADRFACVDFEAVDFSQLGLRENAAAIACLQPITPLSTAPQLSPPPIIVGCIHLLFNPKRGDHKLGQLRVFIERIDTLRSAASQRQIAELGSASGEHVETAEWLDPQVIMTGDFNMEPHSPLYHFLAAGELDCSRVDRRDMSGCLVEGQGIHDSTWSMMMESGGFDRTEEEWEEWEEQIGKRRGREGAKKQQSRAERVAVRLLENYWDIEGLELAVGSSGDDDIGNLTLTKSDVIMSSAQHADAKRMRAMVSAIERGEGSRNVMGSNQVGGWSGRYKIEHCYKGRMHSCYASLCGGNEPPMTSCHGSFTGTVDYMWLTDGLVGERVLMPPVAPKAKLPTEEYPSDHISIVADVKFGKARVKKN